jgi:motility quorum-sensing regulator/GCU-specific mRNA interferase toxin
MASKKLPKGVTRRTDGVLEKLTPHFDIGQVKAVVAQHGAKCFTFSAQQGFQAMGLSLADAIASIAGMDGPDCFYKAMTTYHDEALWQDVYHVSTPKGLAYVKFQVVLPPPGSHQSPKLVISFKAK